MNPNLGVSRPLVSPLFHSAVYQIPDLDAVDAIYSGDPGYIYARDGQPNATLLADELTRLERGTWGIVTSTGMSAIAGPLLALLSAGDRVLASDRLYGKTTKLLNTDLARFGVTTTFVDTNDLDAVRTHLRESKAKVLFAETISNPHCRVADVPALAELCRESGVFLFIDNTFATPILCRPLELGADLVMESLTKMIGGHSDLTLGFVAIREAKLQEKIGPAISTFGMSPSPQDCWLAARGAATLELRMRAATATAAKLAEWLAEQPGVLRVIYPGRADHPDTALAKRILPDGVGNMLCFELANRDAVNRWMRAAPRIPFCPSLGHHETTCSHPDTTSHRYASAEEKRKLTITPGLVRLSVGCEPFEQIQRAMTPSAFR